MNAAVNAPTNAAIFDLPPRLPTIVADSFGSFAGGCVLAVHFWNSESSRSSSGRQTVEALQPYDPGAPGREILELGQRAEQLRVFDRFNDVRLLLRHELHSPGLASADSRSSRAVCP